MTVLLIVWVMFTLFLMSKNEKVLHYRQLAIPKSNIKSKLNFMYLLRLLFQGVISYYAYTASGLFKTFTFSLFVYFKTESSKNLI